jgi:hypothetical protein
MFDKYDGDIRDMLRYFMDIYGGIAEQCFGYIPKPRWDHED